LFIDEAYSLTHTGGYKDYTNEVISTLITAMENKRNELVVIFAGYTKEMRAFVNANSGIASRIGYIFEFEDYKDEELYKIFELKCGKYKLKISDDVKQKTMELFKYFSSVENFGNGRFVDKVLQEILIKHAGNKNLKDNLNVILPEDVPTIKEMIEITFSDRDHMVLPADITDDVRRKIAIHELGHAIVYYVLNGETNLKVITVVPEGNGNLGYVLHTNPPQKVLWTKEEYLNAIKVSLAGRAAEELVYGKDQVTGGCSEDLKHVTDKLNYMFNVCGMSESFGLMRNNNADALSTSLQMALEQEKKSVLEMCYQDATTILKNSKDLFDKCIDELMKKGTLTGEEFVQLIK
jgi:hypothetical protein